MKTPTKLTMLALLALALTSGCATKPTTTTLITPTALQTTQVSWDDAIAARTAANVNNNSLIIMR